MSPELLDFEIYYAVNFIVALHLSYTHVLSFPTDTNLILLFQEVGFLKASGETLLSDGLRVYVRVHMY